MTEEHNESLIKLDLIVRKDEPYRVMEFSRRQQFEVENTPVSIVAAEDLVLSILVWAKDSGSEYQLRDIKQILSAQANLDDDYIDKWAVQPGVEKLLDEVREIA